MVIYNNNIDSRLNKDFDENNSFFPNKKSYSLMLQNNRFFQIEEDFKEYKKSEFYDRKFQLCYLMKKVIEIFGKEEEFIEIFGKQENFIDFENIKNLYIEDINDFLYFFVIDHHELDNRKNIFIQDARKIIIFAKKMMIVYLLINGEFVYNEKENIIDYIDYSSKDEVYEINSPEFKLLLPNFALFQDSDFINDLKEAIIDYSIDYEKYYNYNELCDLFNQTLKKYNRENTIIFYYKQKDPADGRRKLKISLDIQNIKKFYLCKKLDIFIETFLTQDQLGYYKESPIFWNISKSEQKTIMHDFLINYLEEKGKFVVDITLKSEIEGIYYFKDYKLISITSHEFERLISAELFKALKGIKDFHTKIFNHINEIEPCEIFSNFSYNSENNELYISDRGSGYYLIKDSGITHHFNGTNGIYFKIDNSNKENLIVEVGDQLNSLDPENPKRFIKFFDNFEFDLDDRLVDKIFSVDEIKKFLYGYTCCLPFENVIQSKPILILKGKFQTGKTEMEKGIFQFAINQDFEPESLPLDEKDMTTTLTNSNIIGFDNVDGKIPPFFENYLAIAATGGVIPKRHLFTTNSLDKFKLHCFIIITSRSANLKRPDIVSREFIIPMKNFTENHNFYSPQKLSLFWDPLEFKEIYAQYLTDLQGMIKLISEYREEENFSLEESSTRLVNFNKYFTFAMKNLGLYDDEINKMIEKAANLSIEYSFEDDSLISTIQYILSEPVIKKVGQGKLTSFIEATSDDSDGEFLKFDDVPMSSKRLRDILIKGDLENPNFWTARRIVNKLKEIKKELEKIDISFEIIPGRSNTLKYLIKEIKKDS